MLHIWHACTPSTQHSDPSSQQRLGSHIHAVKAQLATDSRPACTLGRKQGVTPTKTQSTYLHAALAVRWSVAAPQGQVDSVQLLWVQPKGFATVDIRVCEVCDAVIEGTRQSRTTTAASPTWGSVAPEGRLIFLDVPKMIAELTQQLRTYIPTHSVPATEAVTLLSRIDFWCCHSEADPGVFALANVTAWLHLAWAPISGARYSLLWAAV